MDTVEKMIYKPLRKLSDSQILIMIEHGNISELNDLPLSVGEYHPDWKFAQDVCVRLSDHYDALVRAKAVLGLAYIARTKGILDRNIVKPIVLRELRENKSNVGIIK